MGQAFDAVTGTLVGALVMATAVSCVAQGVQESERAGTAEAVPIHSSSDDADERYDLAKDLARHGRHAEALQEFLWVWKATRDQQRWIGVRHSFLLSNMEELADAYPPAREAFMRLLEEAQANMETAHPITWLDWVEWTSLCDRFTDSGERAWWFDPPQDGERRIVGWYERHRDAEGRVSAPMADARIQARVESDLFGLLVAQRRFVDAVRVGGDLVGRARDEADSIDSMLLKMEEAAGADPAATSAEDVAQMVAHMHGFFLERQAPVYGVLLAAGEDEAAKALAATVIGHLDTAESRVALVRAALDFDGRQSQQLEAWLDEASGLGANLSDLRSRLGTDSTPR